MIESVFTLLLGVLVILAIIAVNGYFVAQEFAYMAVDRTRLAALSAAGDASATRALVSGAWHYHSHTKRVVSRQLIDGAVRT